jgi:hypothetical protein
VVMPSQLARGLLAKRQQPRRKHKDKRSVLEELVAIDARAMARKGLIPGDYSVWHYDFIVPQARLTVSANKVEILSRDGRQQTVPVHWRTCGGIMCHRAVRPIFVCKCQRQCFRLYDAGGAFRCYRCTNRLGIAYACQTVTPRARPVLQSKRLRQFLGEIPSSTTMRKPLLMHHRTYARLVAKLRQIEARPRSRNYRNKRLGHRLLRPVSMYGTQLAQFAEN